ncbi:MAG: hypothetical protein IPH71_00990 [Proteobacteria bacterium]|nr:hypothetical protein [Pseudomonadota bacterium]
MVALVVTFQHRIHALEHVLRHDVGEEAQPPAVDAQQRDAAAGHQARGIEQRAVAADDHGELGPGHQFDVVDRGGQLRRTLAAAKNAGRAW